jgi:hypothetical protein
MGVTVIFGVAPPARLCLAFAPDVSERTCSDTSSSRFHSSNEGPRRPETLVPYQELALALAPAEVGWSLLVWPEEVHVDDRVDQAKPGLRRDL